MDTRPWVGARAPTAAGGPQSAAVNGRCLASGSVLWYRTRRKMPPHGDARVVILGGGLTGISAAYHLKRPWLLLEKEARLGGHARTDVTRGFHFDKTGHWLHLRDPYTKGLVADLLPDQMVPVERKARIFSHGVLTRFPFQANLHGLPPGVVSECLLGFLAAQQ